MFYRKYNLFGVLFIMLTIVSACSKETVTDDESEINPEEPSINWEIRTDYVENEEVLFSIFPDPGLSAGKPVGYMISFTEPFEAYKDKELAIYAYHKDTGDRVEALSRKEITEPSPGYDSLNEFTTVIELPHSGLWRYEIVFDGQVYGDVILEVNE
ncbi:hypothetical protein ACFSTA_07085 [Ornithinibacillus salinisoli]|uniref:DUF4871 domain-containing protein n=1 Tax=Ornithinibacillus salinisoli TaxID=1848459 RepID=A0ABW4VX06_9BACI